MTPIKHGTASRLGLRKPQLRLRPQLQQAERRVSDLRVTYSKDDLFADVLYEWYGVANGCVASTRTYNDKLTLFVLPVSEQYVRGLKLVDANGRVYAASGRTGR